MTTLFDDLLPLAKTKTTTFTSVPYDVSHPRQSQFIKSFDRMPTSTPQNAVYGEYYFVNSYGKPVEGDLLRKTRQVMFEATGAVPSGTRFVVETAAKVCIVTEQIPAMRQLVFNPTAGLTVHPKVTDRMIMLDGEKSPTIGLISKSWVPYYTTALVNKHGDTLGPIQATYQVLMPQLVHIFVVNKRHQARRNGHRAATDNYLSRNYRGKLYTFAIKGELSLDSKLFLPPLPFLDYLGHDSVMGATVSQVVGFAPTLEDMFLLMECDLNRMIGSARHDIERLYQNAELDSYTATYPIRMGYKDHPIFDTLDEWQRVSEANPEAVVTTNFVPLTETMFEHRPVIKTKTPSAARLRAVLDSLTTEKPVTLARALKLL